MSLPDPPSVDGYGRLDPFKEPSAETMQVFHLQHQARLCLSLCTLGRREIISTKMS